jgi:hypothetical protein
MDYNFFNTATLQEASFMSTLSNAQHIPLFQQALSSYVTELPAVTYWRYANGILPFFGRFLLNHPDLAQAFAADAAALAATRAADEKSRLSLGQSDSAIDISKE